VFVQALAFLLDVFGGIGGIIGQHGDHESNNAQNQKTHGAEKRERGEFVLGEQTDEHDGSDADYRDSDKWNLFEAGSRFDIHRRFARRILFSSRG